MHIVSMPDEREHCISVATLVPVFYMNLLLRCTAKKLKKLRDGDLVYVVYEVKADGTKITYPAKVSYNTILNVCVPK